MLFNNIPSFLYQTSKKFWVILKGFRLLMFHFISAADISICLSYHKIADTHTCQAIR